MTISTQKTMPNELESVSNKIACSKCASDVGPSCTNTHRHLTHIVLWLSGCLCVQFSLESASCYSVENFRQQMWKESSFTASKRIPFTSIGSWKGKQLPTLLPIARKLRWISNCPAFTGICLGRWIGTTFPSCVSSRAAGILMLVLKTIRLCCAMVMWIPFR